MSLTLFSAQTLLEKIRSLPGAARYWIAYSGGMDSHVLLHAFNEIRNSLRADLTAVHIDHGINKNSGDWAEHCRMVCTELGIQLITHRLDGQCPRGESVESWARSRRYRIFREGMGAGEVLCTAQHRDDQAETLLLQLFRGSGPKGLSAMPEIRHFGPGWLMRPLLEFPRDSLRGYALAGELSWIEDAMNADQNYDRNFLRHGILPELRVRWPNLSVVLSRAGAHQAEAAVLLDELAALDIKTHLLPDPNTLSLSGMQNLSMPRRRNLIRYWIRTLDLPAPDSRTLEHILSDVIASREDAQPCISWRGMEIRRYRQVLYLVTRPTDCDSSGTQLWNLGSPYATALGRLLAVRGRGRGISTTALPAGQLAIRYRRGGETIQPAGRKHHHALKKLLQEQHILPWLRDRIPLLYFKEELVAVAGFWIAERYRAGPDEDAWQISWEGAEKVLQK